MRRRRITIAKVNGVGAVDGTLPRFVLERNVLDMLEGNEKYMNLDFQDAQIMVEELSGLDLIRVFTEEMSTEEFRRKAERIL